MFDEVRFPEDISYGAIGGPEYLTKIIPLNSGNEYRNITNSLSKLKYNISYVVKTNEQISKLLTFFRARRGKAIGFRFKDWSDYSAQNELIGIGNDVITQFQLIKIYKSGNSKYIRKITKPVLNSIVLYCDKEKSISDTYQIDYTTGIINFNSPIKKNTKIYANFKFDVPVRFDVDFLPISIDSKNLYSCNNIKLVEINL